ncbi:uncharacterized protein LOC143857094 [Tasmannia lanceolata]|uniref:uncharacterized protein LOC143857094 n=1 Tax=Tasmannia lanceolata TaxID=3420 RepID=UPI004064AF69
MGIMRNKVFVEDCIISIPRNTTLKHILEERYGEDNSRRSESAELKDLLESAMIDDNQIYPIWKPEANGRLTFKSAWNSSRNEHQKVNWASTVWCKGHIPKHSFTTWQALHNRLATMDRLLFLGMSRDTSCLLCGSDGESVDHLFFRCGYSDRICRSILRQFNYRRNLKNSVLKEEEWIRSHFKKKEQCASAMRIAFGAIIYSVWRERNARLHGDPHTHKQSILRKIISIIRDKMPFLKILDEPSASSLCFAKAFRCPFAPVEHLIEECSWVKPDENMIKLNVDASNSAYEAGVGGLLKNLWETPVRLFSINLEPKPIHILEMEAILYGLDLARTKGLKDVWIESDSMVAVKV